MFGRDGAESMIEIWAGNVSEALKDMIYIKDSHFIGLYAGEKKISFWEIYKEHNVWHTGRQAEESWERPGTFQSMAELLAEHAAMRAAREGWGNMPMALCLAKDDCLCRLLPMSEGIPFEERRTAAYWEMDRFLQDCGLSLEMASCTSAKVPGEAGVMEGLVLEKEKADCLVAAFVDKGCHLAGLFPEARMVAEAAAKLWGEERNRTRFGSAGVTELSHEQKCAMFAAAALAGLAQQGCPENFLAHGGDSWNFEKLSKMAGITAAVIIAVMLVFDLGQLYVSYSEAKAVRRQMAEMEPARQVMESDKKLAESAERKEKYLLELSRNSKHFDSVLIHLGNMTVEGAWLTEVSCKEGGSLELRGRAVDYSALSEMMKAFENDRLFFSALPLLEDSRQDDEGMIDFRLKLEI